MKLSFIDYCKATDFPSFCRIKKKYAPMTTHYTFFLILYEMGLEDRDVRRIMGITQEVIRCKIPDSAKCEEIKEGCCLLIVLPITTE